MPDFWRISAQSTAAAKVEKFASSAAGNIGKQRVPRLLGYRATQYAGATAAGVNIVLEQGPSSVTILSSAVVGTIGAATEMAPVEAYSSAGLAKANYLSLKFSASVATSTQFIDMWGDYGGA